MPYASPAGPYVLASHGTHSPVGRACIRALTTAVRLRRPDIEFADAFVSVQSPTSDDVVRALSSPSRRITIVPVLLSTGYHVQVDLHRAADAAPGTTLTQPLGPDPRLVEVLARRLTDAGLHPDDERAVTIADAGSRNLAAQRDVNAMAGLLARRLGRPVTASHATAAAPLTSDLARGAHQEGRRLAVASYLLAPGHFADRLSTSGADLVTLPLIPPAAADDPGAVPEELIDLVLHRAGLRETAQTLSA